MNRQHHAPRFHHRLHLLILRRLVILANIICLSCYVFLRMIFYDLPFVMQEELLIALKIVGWSTGGAVAFSFIIFAVDGLAYLLRNRKQFGFPKIVHVAETSPNKNTTS